MGLHESEALSGVIRIHGGSGDAVSHQYGNKGLRLAEVARLGFRVPDGLLLSVQCLSMLVKACGMADFISDITLRETRGETSLEATVIEAFEKVTPDASIRSALADRLRKIDGYHDKMRFAVRSAAVGEDDGSASYAGQYATILEVSPENLWPGIIECYASWWSDRVMAYRRKNQIPAREPLLSVIVQRQLIPRAAGVLFTRHPVLSDSDAMVVEAVAGLGDKLVSGEITPDRWEISRTSGKVDPCSSQNAAPILSDRHLNRLFSIGKDMESHFGQGMDLEWAVEDDRVYVLQARPITTKTPLKTSPPQPVNQSAEDLARNIYSRAIIEDLWADRMTDITGSIVFDEFADLYTFKTPLKRLKLHRMAAMDAVKVINGYGYLNSQAIALLLELVPKSLRFKEVSLMFPPSIRKAVLETPFNLKKMLGLLPRLPLLFTDAAMIPLLTRGLLRKHLIAIENDLNRVDVETYPRMGPRELGRELERVLVLQGKLQERNQWGYGNATVFTWLLRHVASTILGLDEKWALERITKIPSNVTVASQRRLEAICRMCDQEIIKKVFRGRDGKDAWKILSSEFDNHPVTEAIREFVKTYRFRSANRDFIHPRWDEKPEIVVSMMSVIIAGFEKTPKTGSDSSPKSEISKNGARRGKWASVILSPLINATRKSLALREDLRFCLDKIFHRIRRILLAASETPEFAALKEIPDGVFFLTLNELRSLFAGQTTADTLRPEVESRQKAFEKEKEIPPAYYLRIDKPSEHVILTDDAPQAILSGIPASSGIVEGVARVIRGAHEFHLLKTGEILVAFNTDPGWTPLFMSAAGVVVEMGGILNHCAIVAREYGVPAVVGIKGVSRKIQTGQRVRVDGNTGVVEFL